MTGRRLLHYEILEKLGDTGSSTVYKARDTRLNRLVAIKALRAEQHSQEGNRRFIEEAQAVGALDHPNMIRIHDIVRENDTDYIVMEFVAGKTLEPLIPNKGLRLDQLLPYAIAIADAIAAAHAAGVIHRNLKPSSVLLGDSGQIKVLEFGSAEPLEERAETGENHLSSASTRRDPLSTEIAYSAPERIEGNPLDARSDIFSFGAVLYEMVTGQRPFRGKSAQAVRNAILFEDPKPPNEITVCPPYLERIINRCLRKEPARRFQMMADVKISLEELLQERSAERPARPVRLRTASIVAGMVLLVFLGAGITWLFTRQPSNPPPLKVVPLTTSAGSEVHPSFSPDGNQIAFSWNGDKRENYDIYIRLVDVGPALRLTRDPANDVMPVWSPDGRQIAFVREGVGVFLISPLGGQERKLTDASGAAAGWTRDSKSVAIVDRDTPAGPLGIFLVSLATRERRRLTPPDHPVRSDSSFAFSPDGENLAFVGTAPTASEIFVMSLKTGAFRRMTSELTAKSGVTWTPDGREIVYASSRSGIGLWRLAVKSGSPGRPKPLPGVASNAGYPVLAGGTPGQPAKLAYQQTFADENIWGADIDAQDPVRTTGPARQLIASTRADEAPQVSPDGERIAFASDRSGTFEIWACNVDGSAPIQLTTLGAYAGSPRWSSDGRRIAFDFFTQDNRDIYVVDADGGAPRRMTTEPSVDGRPSWSRDGRWIYFRSDRSGTQQIWKVASEGPGTPVVVTRNGGFDAFASVDGKLLYFTKSSSQSGLWSMPVEGGPESLVVSLVQQGSWSVSERGIYFADRPAEFSPVQTPTIQFFDFATRQIRPVLTLAKEVPHGPAFSASRDGRRILWVQVDNRDADLMLVENFR